MEEGAPKIHFKVKSDRTKVETGRSSNLVYISTQILLVFASFFLIYNVVKSVDLTIQKIDILKQAEKEIDDLRLKNIDLILTQEQVETDDFVETEARDRLNLAKAKEQVFVISDTALEYGKLKVNQILDPSQGKGKEEKPFVQWVRLLFGLSVS